VNFFRTRFGSLLAIFLMHLGVFVFVKIFDIVGFFTKNLFNGIFHIGLGKIFDFKPFVAFLVKAPVMKSEGFSFQNWYEQYFYTWIITCIVVSLIFSIICYLICNSIEAVAKDMRPTWWTFAIILLFIAIICGIIWTPLLNSVPAIMFTWFIYFFIGFIPFYISTFLFCGYAAFGSYEIKTKLLSE